MRRYQLRRSMFNSPPSAERAAVAGGPAPPRSDQGRSCLRQLGCARLRRLAAAALRRPLPAPRFDDVDQMETEQPADPFRDVSWWTWDGAASSAKRVSEPPAQLDLSSSDGDDSQDIATILRRALMDLAAALQEIERQLTSIPDDGAVPTRG
jgi:hypothetical protein